VAISHRHQEALHAGQTFVLIAGVDRGIGRHRRAKRQAPLRPSRGLVLAQAREGQPACVGQLAGQHMLTDDAVAHALSGKDTQAAGGSCSIRLHVGVELEAVRPTAAQAFTHSLAIARRAIPVDRYWPDRAGAVEGAQCVAAGLQGQHDQGADLTLVAAPPQVFIEDLHAVDPQAHGAGTDELDRRHSSSGTVQFA
jgi:hypothetical protein